MSFSLETRVYLHRQTLATIAHIYSLKSVELIFVLLPVKGEYDGQKIILNGVDKEEWKLRDNFITLNTPTAVDRVGIRATVETLKQIYAVSIFSFSLY